MAAPFCLCLHHPVETQHYLVCLDHTSEYPEPICLAKGTLVAVGETYAGPEGWDNWLFCEAKGQAGGWVPAQILEFVDAQTARSREDYTARELNVRTGDVLTATKALNGWLWCQHSESAASGWVPQANLQAIAPEPQSSHQSGQA